MARFDSYPNKSAPDDSDTLLIHDTSGSANKQVLLSGVFTWLKAKLTSSSVDGLDTASNTIIGAINENKADIDSVVTDVSAVETTIGNSTLTTTAQDITGAVNELDAELDTKADAADCEVATLSEAQTYLGIS